MVSAAGDFVYAKFSQYYNSTYCYFLSCFLVFFFVKDQIASFQLKQIIVFLN